MGGRGVASPDNKIKLDMKDDAKNDFTENAIYFPPNKSL